MTYVKFSGNKWSRGIIKRPGLEWLSQLAASNMSDSYTFSSEEEDLEPEASQPATKNVKNDKCPAKKTMHYETSLV
jgi:hypothetical protein